VTGLPRSSVKAGPMLERFAEVVAFFVKKPRTIPELNAWLGTQQRDTGYRYVDALRSEGLLYILEWRKGATGVEVAVYAWQPSVAERPDAPRPVKVAA
jgi:hypothetical protein